MQHSSVIYKICRRDEWRQAVRQGHFAGSAVDLQDGFIHFSAAHQVSATFQKHFAGQADLVVISVGTNGLGDALKWEVSRGGDLFPHLYGPLAVDGVLRVDDLRVTDDGVVILPDSDHA